MSYPFDYETHQTYQVKHAEYERIAEAERLAELGRAPASRRARRNVLQSLGQFVFGIGKRFARAHTPRTLPQA